MDIESIKVITDCIIEVTKYLGPATITAIFGYAVGKSQFKGKLKELKEVNAYYASEKLFEYYQNREKELDEAYKSINHDLGFILGLDVANDLNDDIESLNEKIKIYDLFEKMLPYQIKLTMRDLKKYNLKDTEEFEKLKKILSEELPRNRKNNLNDKITLFLEIYFYLRICNKRILEEISTNYMKIHLINSKK